MGYNTIMCPFCASTNLDAYCLDDGYSNCPYNKEDVTWAIICDGCNAEGPTGKTKEDAIEKWNNRI